MKLAAVLIRGKINVQADIKAALRALNLNKRHACVIVDDNPMYRGLMQKCKDYISYGPVSDDMVSQLQSRGTVKDKQNVVRLHPPRGGYGGKGIKVSYQEGGVLGLRRESMDQFLQRML